MQPKEQKEQKKLLIEDLNSRPRTSTLLSNDHGTPFRNLWERDRWGALGWVWETCVFFICYEEGTAMLASEGRVSDIVGQRPRNGTYQKFP